MKYVISVGLILLGVNLFGISTTFDVFGGILFAAGVYVIVDGVLKNALQKN